jgi:hypothetical protein
MNDLLVSLVLLAQDSPGPTGDNPDDSGGIIIIVGIALVVLIVGLALVTAFRRGRARPEAMQRRPARDGSVGRISEFKDS